MDILEADVHYLCSHFTSDTNSGIMVCNYSENCRQIAIG